MDIERLQIYSGRMAQEKGSIISFYNL
jgi:hypothetical protein